MKPTDLAPIEEDSSILPATAATANWIDPDTFKSKSKTTDKNTYRVQGYNAPEVNHIKDGRWITGQYQGESALIPEAARISGFNQVDITGTDKYKRQLANVTNPTTGETLSNFAVKTGLAPVNNRTSESAISDKTYLKSFSILYPELADQDPVLAAAKELKKAKQKALKEQGLPRYIVGLNAPNEATYAYHKNAVGTGAQNRILERLKQIESDLNTYGGTSEIYDPLTGAVLGEAPSGITDSQRNMLLKEKANLVNDLQYAAMAPDVYTGVDVRSQDRTIMNKSRSNLGTMSDSMWLGLYENTYGIGQLIGDSTGWETLSQKASKNVKLNQMEKGQLPESLSFSDIGNANGAWGTISTGASFIAGQLINSLPYIVAITGAEIATGGMASPLIAGTLATIPVSALYAGQFYAEQPDDKKDPMLAVMTALGSGILDKFSLNLLLGANLFTKVGEKEAVSAIVAKSNGRLTEAEARNLLHTETKSEILKLTGFSNEFAMKQIKSAEAMAKRSGDLVIRAGAESITETAQQELEMLGQSGQRNLNYHYTPDYYNQLKEAAGGGFLVGGAFGGVHHSIDMAGWHGAADLQALNEKMLGDAQRFNAQNHENLLNQTGGYRTVQEMSRTESKNAQNNNAGGLDTIPTHTGFFRETVLPMITNPLSNLRQLAHTAIPSIVNEDGSFKTNLAKIKSIMGGFGILPGEHASGFRQRLLGKWSEEISGDDLAAQLGVSKEEAQKYVQVNYDQVWSQGGTLGGDAFSDTLQAWKDRLDNVQQSMISLGQVAGVNTLHLSDTNALFQAAEVDPALWAANKLNILTEMVNANADQNSARTAINNLTSKNKQEASLARDYLNQFNVFTNPNLSHLFKQGIFDNIEHHKDQMANSIMANTYFGKNGQVLAELLRKAKAAGEFKDDADYKNTATQVKAFYDIMNNNFHPLAEESLINKTLGWSTTMSMLAYLGKAAVSSMAETSIATLGTPGHLIGKQLSTFFKSYFKETASDINKGVSYAASRIGINMLRSVPSVSLQNKIDTLINKQQDPNLTLEEYKAIQDEVDKLVKENFGQKMINRLGYNETGAGAALRYDYANTAAGIQRKIMGIFARAITLRAQTDANRIAVLSVGSDIMLTQLQSLASVPETNRIAMFSTGMGLTKEQAQALTELQSYGLDVHGFLSQMDKMPDLNPFSQDFMSFNATTPEAQHLQDNVATALSNMVDQRIVNPQAFNTPKIFNDPRFRIITAMGRFMATAQAVVLPRLYKQYLLEGNMAMRYSAFTTIAMSLIAGHMVNMLKNGLSYGDDDSPYVKSTAKKTQRLIYSSGLLGQGEKLWERVDPLYDFHKSPNLFDTTTPKGKVIEGKPVDWAYSQIKNASPQASWAANVGEGLYDIEEGKTDKGAKKLAKAAPVLGSFPWTQQAIANAFKKEGK